MKKFVLILRKILSSDLLIYLFFLIPIFWKQLLAHQDILWFISWYSLVILMAIRPLSDIFKSKTLRMLIPVRKSLWVLSAMVVVTNAFYTYFAMSGNFFNTFLSFYYWWFNNMQFFGHLGEITWLILLISSNIFSQRLLWKSWKNIQKLSYVYFFSWWIFIFHLWKVDALYWMIVIWLITLFAFMRNNKIIFKH